MPTPKALVLRAPGTNCDEETADAWRMAGAEVETWHVQHMLDSPRELDQFQVLTIPGGFSYGDDLGAGRILATRLHALGDEFRRFHEQGGLILGICNGFQVLVRAGLLPGGPTPCKATLAHNDSGHFESRWVRLQAVSGRTPFLKTSEVIELPVAHGEGKFLTSSPSELEALHNSNQVVLRYVDAEGNPTQTYPANPNGSPAAVAGICDPTGRIFGLMPHPERFLTPFHHPRWTRLGPKPEGDGLQIFRSAVEALRS